MYHRGSLHMLVYSFTGAFAGSALMLVLDAALDDRNLLSPFSILVVIGALFGMIAGLFVGAYFREHYWSTETPAARRLRRRFLLREAAVLAPILLVSALVWNAFAQ